LVHRELIIEVVEVKHMLTIDDVVDHHFRKKKCFPFKIQILLTLIVKLVVFVMVNQEKKEEIVLVIKYLFDSYYEDVQNDEAFLILKNPYKVLFLAA